MIAFGMVWVFYSQKGRMGEEDEGVWFFFAKIVPLYNLIQVQFESKILKFI